MGAGGCNPLRPPDLRVCADGFESAPVASSRPFCRHGYTLGTLSAQSTPSAHSRRPGRTLDTVDARSTPWTPLPRPPTPRTPPLCPPRASNVHRRRQVCARGEFTARRPPRPNPGYHARRSTSGAFPDIRGTADAWQIRWATNPLRALSCRSKAGNSDTNSLLNRCDTHDCRATGAP